MSNTQVMYSVAQSLHMGLWERETRFSSAEESETVFEEKKLLRGEGQQ